MIRCSLSSRSRVVSIRGVTKYLKNQRCIETRALGADKGKGALNSSNTYASFISTACSAEVNISTIFITLSCFISLNSLNSLCADFEWIGVAKGRLNFLMATFLPVFMFSAALKKGLAIEQSQSNRRIPGPYHKFCQTYCGQSEIGFGN